MTPLLFKTSQNEVLNLSRMTVLQTGIKSPDYPAIIFFDGGMSSKIHSDDILSLLTVLETLVVNVKRKD